MDQAQRNYSCMLDTSNKATRLPGLEIQWPLHLWWAGWGLCSSAAITTLQHCSSLSDGAGFGYVINFHFYNFFPKPTFLFFLKKALPVLIRPPESKLYLLKQCNIVHNAVMAALLLPRLVAPQGCDYPHVPDHPELDRTALCSSLL